MSTLKATMATLALCAASTAAGAGTINWTDWTAATANTATGTVMAGGNSVGVSAVNTANFHFVRTDGGTNYYTGSAYTRDGGVTNDAPTTSDILALGAGGTVTFTFSQAVSDIYLAMVSWNVPGTVNFSAPVEVVSAGCGYFGCGSATVTGNTVNFGGEAHGLLKLSGDFTSFSLTGPTEYWHGLTVGFADVAPVPLPASALLLAGGVAGMAALRRRRRQPQQQG